MIAADDVVFPPDAITRLVEADKDIVSGIYRKSMVYQLTPANYTETWEEFAGRYKEGGVYETQFGAAHSMTIQRHVIEKMVLDYPELAYKQDGETHYALFLPMIKGRNAFRMTGHFRFERGRAGLLCGTTTGAE